MSAPRAAEPGLESVPVRGRSMELELGSSTQTSHRLLAYSDALLSIIATVMILPVAHTKIHPDQKLGESVQQLLLAKIAVYLMTFLIVTVAWAAHVRLFQVIELIDDVLALLNLACMMIITFLPYTFSLMASFPEVPFGIFLFSVCAVVIGLIQAVIVAYGFYHPHLLNRQIQVSENQNFYKHHILKIILRGPILCFLAAICSFFFIPLSYVLLGLVIVFPHLTRFTTWCKTKIVGTFLRLPHVAAILGKNVVKQLARLSEPENKHGGTMLMPIMMGALWFAVRNGLPYSLKDRALGALKQHKLQGEAQLQKNGVTDLCGRMTAFFLQKDFGRRDEQEEHHSLETFTFYLSEPLSKERVEGFSDGVYAIVATLLILDICEDNVPDPREVEEKFHGSLLEALSEYGPNYLAYFGSFVTIGLLWFVHHSLFLYVTKATRLMGLLNILSLAFIGGLPLAYQLTSEFAEKSHNEIEAIQVSCVITFFASIFQFAIWTTALLHERETLHPFARYGGKEHAFMFAKLALYPCVSLGVFFLTCLLSEFSTAIFHLMQIVIPFAFLALRIFVRIALTVLRSVMSLSRRKVVLLEEEEACLSPTEPLS